MRLASHIKRRNLSFYLVKFLNHLLDFTYILSVSTHGNLAKAFFISVYSASLPKCQIEGLGFGDVVKFRHAVIEAEVEHIDVESVFCILNPAPAKVKLIPLELFLHRIFISFSHMQGKKGMFLFSSQDVVKSIKI